MKQNNPKTPYQLVCPACHSRLKKKASTLICTNCSENYEVSSNIPVLIPKKALKNKALKTSLAGYQKAFQGEWQKINDGSYEILATIARGNKTLDIACGEGFIEQLSPETVAVDFSLNALIKARQNGARHLVCCTAEYLPFPKNHFDLALCAGSLEHFADPQKALNEMARVAPLQVVTVHRELPFPFARKLRSLASRIKGLKHQPIEKPLYFNELKNLYQKANLKMVFHGLWTYPTNLRLVFPFLPESLNPPCAYFIISRHI